MDRIPAVLLLIASTVAFILLADKGVDDAIRGCHLASIIVLTMVVLLTGKDRNSN